MLRQLTGSGDEIRIFPSNCYWYYLSTLLKHWFGVVRHRSSLVGQEQNRSMEECQRCGETSLGSLRHVLPGPFALVLRLNRSSAFFWTHLTCFAFSTYYSCPRGFWFADLLATIDFLRRCWPFPNEMSCHYPSAHSRRWLSAPWPSPSFSELPRSPPLSRWECWDGCASNKTASTSWKRMAKRREGSIISRHHPSHVFCSAQVMLNICISYVQTLKLP